MRPIAIYLPQFHPIPENDAWWGKGFTEWTNVAKAKPLFKGHYQPHLPADLGFYDLRLEEARLAQEALAKQYGIYGFCYYHYWFNGKRMLHEPIERKLKNPKEDLPFMFCWANENWTRTWDGMENEVLLKQEYSFEDDRNHIKSLIPYFKDSRYIRINNKPVFAIYRSTLFPDIKRTISIWREEALKEGIELYLCRFEKFSDTGAAFAEYFDAAIEFPPHIKMQATSILKDGFTFQRLQNSITYRSNKAIKSLKQRIFFSQARSIIKYADFVENAIKRYTEEKSYKVYPCVMPGWDNSARKKTNCLIIHESTPALFGKWVEEAARKFLPYSKDENLFFVNAWNEWAEGNHLEPDKKWGHAYLKALKDGINFSNNSKFNK